MRVSTENLLFLKQGHRVHIIIIIITNASGFVLPSTRWYSRVPPLKGRKHTRNADARSKNRPDALGICCDAILTFFSTCSLFINGRRIPLVQNDETLYTYIFFFFSKWKSKTISAGSLDMTIIIIIIATEQQETNASSAYTQILQESLARFNNTTGRPTIECNLYLTKNQHMVRCCYCYAGCITVYNKHVYNHF